MVIETRSVILRNFGEIHLAGTNAERAVDKPQDFLSAYSLHVRSEIFRAVVFEFSDYLYARKRLFNVDFYERITFIVF